MSGGLKKSLLALSVSSVFMASSAFATNGYFAHGYSTKEKGLAGAGVAHSTDALASATNPAGMVKVGERMDVGGALFNPNRQYTVDGAPSGAAGSFPLSGGTFESSHKYFFIPHFAYNWMLDNTSSFGIAAYGNGGMNTDYKNVPSAVGGAGTFGGGNAGVNLAQLFINASYSKQVNNDNSVGVSLIFAYQMFRATGLGAFGQQGFSVDATKLTDNGDSSSTGFGAKLGWQGDVTSDLTLGVSYQSKISMSQFDEYAGLFAEGGDFDIPSTMTIGMAWSVDKSSTVVLDVQQIYYSDVAALGNGIENLFAVFNPANGALIGPENRLGGANGAGFGWEDMTIVKLGYEWAVNDMTYRVGISNGSQPIPGGGQTTARPNGSQTLFNLLAPAVMETHITFGLTMPIDSSSELSIAGMYAPSSTIAGSTQFDSQVTTLKMDQTEIQATYSMKF